VTLRIYETDVTSCADRLACLEADLSAVRRQRARLEAELRLERARRREIESQYRNTLQVYSSFLDLAETSPGGCLDLWDQVEEYTRQRVEELAP